ncbi:hypothetical protein [Actinomadura napierensis]|uniref:hypothetical protein n=1 Tax=Actinomadura napierensis TaxID=267854 RepID=UPI0031DF0C44
MRRLRRLGGDVVRAGGPFLRLARAPAAMAVRRAAAAAASGRAAGSRDSSAVISGPSGPERCCGAGVPAGTAASTTPGAEPVNARRPGGLGDRQRAGRSEPVIQRRGADELHHDPRVAVLHDDVVDRDDGRVADLRGRAPPAAPAPHGGEARLVEAVRQQDLLHRDVASEQVVAGPPDRAHAAADGIWPGPARAGGGVEASATARCGAQGVRRRGRGR